ncbi:MAG: hypothetical protein G01um101456_609 [Parcubacteria group bacterium Gr01-1014_56]|nr:MAG: hypothetical protein G01um101456_609 [Parcubacteria group bacterium Gr01-1014_56]
MVILYLALAYFFIVWIGTRLIVPHLGFNRELLPPSIPAELDQRIRQFDHESISNLDFLKKSYGFVTQTYQGSRFKTITNFWKAFQNPLNLKPGFMPCNGQNYLLRLMLIKSDRFTEKDIQIRIVPLNFFIHQYLRINVDGQWVEVDPWSAFLGVPFGKKSAFLG